MNKFMKANKEIEKAVVSGYKNIEDSVVSGYKSIEDGFVGGYKKIENKFVETFLTPDDESSSEEVHSVDASERVCEEDRRNNAID